MYILIMVYILSQKTTSVVVEFDSKLACEQAGIATKQQVYAKEGMYPDGFVCAAKK